LLSGRFLAQANKEMFWQKVNAPPRDPAKLMSIGAIHYLSARFFCRAGGERHRPPSPDRRGIARLADSAFTAVDRDH
jgi:hypothetical protein